MTLLPLGAGWKDDTTAAKACVAFELAAILAILVLVILGRSRRWHERWLEYRLTARLRAAFPAGRPAGRGPPLSAGARALDYLRRTRRYLDGLVCAGR